MWRICAGGYNEHMQTAAPALNYLTVQDLLWVNLQLTKTSNAFDYALLEEATFYQYGYGQSKDLIGQAAKFLTGFAKKQPFGGRADAETALIGCVAFLALNGHHVALPASEAKSWLLRVTGGQIDAAEALSQLAHASEDHHAASPAECLRDALETYGPALMG